MFSIKIAKTSREAWPGEYHRLDVLLRPVLERLRPLWWVMKDHECCRIPAAWFTEERDDMARFDASFVPGVTPPVARPGFLPAYADIVTGDWSILCGVPGDPTPDRPLLDAVARMGWFDPPATFPPALSVVIRGVDGAYWEVFARDATVIGGVHDHLKGVPGLRLERAVANDA